VTLESAGAVSGSSVMRIWHGQTPDGYSLVIDRDERGQWVATVAAVSRSRSVSLETALLEAAGSSAPRE
jgi:hypothetical protein